MIMVTRLGSSGFALLSNLKLTMSCDLMAAAVAKIHVLLILNRYNAI